jgi:hypothetical protein
VRTGASVGDGPISLCFLCVYLYFLQLLQENYFGNILNSAIISSFLVLNALLPLILSIKIKKLDRGQQSTLRPIIIIIIIIIIIK